MDWWKRYPVYQIYPRSFKDSNGDGIGDINGILRKLDYFQWLGIKVLWLSPIYKSPMKDFGYDISDYREIDPIFGNLDDFKLLSNNLREKGMYLIMDFVPNHTSDQHRWFLASKAGQEPYVDYYVWRDARIDPDTKERRPPNEVVSVFGGPAWTWCEERHKYYLHHFLPEQPDLNYKNSNVRREMTDVLKYWVDLGVDGFRVDAVPFLGKDEADTAVECAAVDGVESKSKCGRSETFDVTGPSLPSYELINEWVQFLKRNYEVAILDGDVGKPVANPRHIFMCTEAYADLDSVIRYYDSGADFSFNFALVNWSKKSNAKDLRRWVNEWMKKMQHEEKGTPSKRKHENGERDDASGRWPNWVAGNHDQPRVATRLGGPAYANVVNTLLMTLPGTPTCYQGDELGMEDVAVSFDQCQDPYGKRFGPDRYAEFTRDPCRSPMIWNGDMKQGGFTPAEQDDPWLPLHKDKGSFAVDRQQKDPNSRLNFFRRLLRLRDSAPTFHQFGHNLRLLGENEDSLFAYERYAPEGRTNKEFVIVLNVDHNPDAKIRELDLSAEIDNRSAKIVLTSCTDDERNYQEGEQVDLGRIMMKPAEVLVLSLEAVVPTKRVKRE